MFFHAIVVDGERLLLLLLIDRLDYDGQQCCMHCRTSSIGILVGHWWVSTASCFRLNSCCSAGLSIVCDVTAGQLMHADIV